MSGSTATVAVVIVGLLLVVAPLVIILLPNRALPAVTGHAIGDIAKGGILDDVLGGVL